MSPQIASSLSQLLGDLTMIQWYINSRPVPRAIARNHLENAMPYRTANDIKSAMTHAIKGEQSATKIVESCGVSVFNLKGK